MIDLSDKSHHIICKLFPLDYLTQKLKLNIWVSRIRMVDILLPQTQATQFAMPMSSVEGLHEHCGVGGACFNFRVQMLVCVLIGS